MATELGHRLCQALMQLHHTQHGLVLIRLIKMYCSPEWGTALGNRSNTPALKKTYLLFPPWAVLHQIIKECYNMPWALNCSQCSQSKDSCVVSVHSTQNRTTKENKYNVPCAKAEWEKCVYMNTLCKLRENWEWWEWMLRNISEQGGKGHILKRFHMCINQLPPIRHNIELALLLIIANIL